MQSDNTDNMMFPVAEMLVYVTQGMTLEPGDIIFTGTPSGVGHARKPNPIWMKARRRLRDRDRGDRRAAQSDPGRGVAARSFPGAGNRTFIPSVIQLAFSPPMLRP